MYFLPSDLKSLQKQVIQVLISRPYYKSCWALQQFINMQGQTYKIIHLQTLESKPVQANHFKGETLWNQNGQKTLLTYQETCKPNEYAQFDNGFFSAFLKAYNNHGDVKINPDDVWIAIMLYFSKYVNDHAQELRSAFVSHQGKQKLVVTTKNESSQGQWNEFFTLMIDAIKNKTTKGVTQKFQCNFTTTGRLEKIISTATIMNTYQQYFKYQRCIPFCGIQNVHFGGTLADWKSVLQKTYQLKDYDVNGQMKAYVDRIAIILQKFIDTYEGKVDLDFWNKIVNKERGSLGSGSTSKYTGWLIHFFGYQQPEEEIKISQIGFDINIDNRQTGVYKTVRLVGGFKAVSSEGNIYRPHLSFAIQDGPGATQKPTFRRM